MGKNRVSAVMTDEQKKQALSGLETIRKALPFLVSLSTEERKNTRVMGSKRIEYVNMNAQAAKSYPDALPGSFNLQEFLNDVSLYNNLSEFRVSLMTLVEAVDDTMSASSLDAMNNADQVYAFMKATSRSNPDAKTHLAGIKKLNARQAKQNPPV